MPVILCADDDVEIRNLYQVILGKRYDLKVCENGAQALAAFEQEGADMILLDVDMPVMNGLDACKRFRQHPDGYDVPIVMVSANDTEDDIVLGLSYGADDYIIKPVKPAELLAKIGVVLKKRTAAVGTELGLGLGSYFAGRYQLVSKLGSGGSGTVYEARDCNTEHQPKVALKLYDLPPSKRNDDSFVTRFLREAYMQAKLKHPGIAELLDFGQSGNTHYIVLEFIRGSTLETMVERYGPLEESRLLEIARMIGEALEYMDSHKILHRDIKPGNILIADSGAAKLADFGLAKIQEENTLSGENEFQGTPQYVSPEQITGTADLDIRSDLYSFGATLYFAATARKPFSGNGVIAILRNHFSETPTPVHELNDRVSEKFSKMIVDMMITKRNDRLTLAQFMATLDELQPF